MKKKLFLVTALSALIFLAACGESYAAAPDNGENEPERGGITLSDGIYTAKFKTDSSMFRVNEANDGKGILTVKDGNAVIHVSLMSKKIINLYPGMAADAPADEAGWLQPSTDTVTYSDGFSEDVFGFDIPVPCIDEEFDLALLGKKEVWYDHKVRVKDPVPALFDGSYLCEAAIQGGSGRAGIESPAEITVDGETITATIVWSSPFYEYMLINDVQYDPIQKEGNSTFEIPVTLDEDMAVSASTAAMSEPHLIDYTLHFDSSTIKGK